MLKSGYIYKVIFGWKPSETKRNYMIFSPREDIKSVRSLVFKRRDVHCHFAINLAGYTSTIIGLANAVSFTKSFDEKDIWEIESVMRGCGWKFDIKNKKIDFNEISKGKGI